MPNEALKTFAALTNKVPSNENIQHIAQALFEKMNVHSLLIHPVDRAIVVSSKGLTEKVGRVVTHPAILTGGGDNLNAGFCFGLLNNFSDGDCALLGMAASGAYVQNGTSPTVPALIDYLKTL